MKEENIVETSYEILKGGETKKVINKKVHQTKIFTETIRESKPAESVKKDDHSFAKEDNSHSQSTTQFDALFADTIADQSDIFPKRLPNISEEPENTMMANSGYNSTRTLRNSVILNQSQVLNISPDTSPRNFAELVAKTEIPLSLVEEKPEISVVQAADMSPSANKPAPPGQRQSPSKPIHAQQTQFRRKDHDKKKPPTIVSANEGRSGTGFTKLDTSKSSLKKGPLASVGDKDKKKVMRVGSRSNTPAKPGASTIVRTLLHSTLGNKGLELQMPPRPSVPVGAGPKGTRGVQSYHPKQVSQLAGSGSKIQSGSKQSVMFDGNLMGSCNDSQRSNSLKSLVRTSMAPHPIEKLRGVLSSQALKQSKGESSLAGSQVYKESSVSLSRDDFGAAVALQFKSDRGFSPFATVKGTKSLAKVVQATTPIVRKTNNSGLNIRGPVSMQLDNLLASGSLNKGYSGKDGNSRQSRDDDFFADEGTFHHDNHKEDNVSISVKSSRAGAREFDLRSENNTIDGTPKKGRMAGSSRKSSYYEYSSQKSGNKRYKKPVFGGIENFAFGLALSKKATDQAKVSEMKDSLLAIQKSSPTVPSPFSNFCVKAATEEPVEKSCSISTTAMNFQAPKFTKSQALPSKRSGKDFLAMNKQSVKGGLQMIVKSLKEHTKMVPQTKVHQIIATKNFSKQSSGTDHFGSKPSTNLTVAPNSWEDSSIEFGQFSSIDDFRMGGHKPAHSDSWNRKILPGTYSGKFVETGSPQLPKHKVFSPRGAFTRQ